MDELKSWDVLIDEQHGNRAEFLLAINDNYPAETPKHDLTGTINPVNSLLVILEEWGLIEVEAHEQQSDRIPTRVFSLTDRGREAVEDLLARTDARPIPWAVEHHIESFRSDAKAAKIEAKAGQNRNESTHV